jgi:soluble lytic murein transglycosylase-like protein
MAQVIEIGPAGVVTRAGPMITTDRGVTPIIPDRPAPAAADPNAGRLASAAPMFTRAGQAVELSPRLLEAVSYVESRFNPTAVSPKGAVGLMQLRPETAAELGFDPHNPETNARGGATYLRRMLALFDNNVELALAAYNAGPQAVKRYGGVPPYPETRAYVAAVLDYMARSSEPNPGVETK